jgi:hypothetical protein
MSQPDSPNRKTHKTKRTLPSLVWGEARVPRSIDSRGPNPSGSTLSCPDTLVTAVPRGISCLTCRLESHCFQTVVASEDNNRIPHQVVKQKRMYSYSFTVHKSKQTKGIQV